MQTKFALRTKIYDGVRIQLVSLFGAWVSVDSSCTAIIPQAEVDSTSQEKFIFEYCTNFQLLMS